MTGTTIRPASFAGIEWWFAGVLAIAGMAFALTIAPGHVPDEDYHFWRAYRVSEGHLRLSRSPLGYGTAPLPADVAGILRYTVPPEARPTSLPLFRTEPLAPGRVYPDYLGSSMYTFAPYLPQAAAIRVGRAFDLSPSGLVLAGRLVSLALSVVLLWLTVRIAPVGKLMFGVAALLPITVQQSASTNPDVLVFGLGLLLVAILMRRAVLGDEGRTWLYLTVAILLTGVLGFCKLPYAALGLFWFAARPERSRRAYWLGGAAVLGVGAVGIVLAQWLVLPHLPEVTFTEPYLASRTMQTALLRADPSLFVKAAGNAVASISVGYLDQLFTLGLLDTPIHFPIMRVGQFLLLAFAFAELPTAPVPSVRARLAGLLTAGTIATLILLSMYVWWSPVGGSTIEGVQGRYFVPLLPFLVLLRTSGVRIDIPARPLAGFVVGMLAVILATSWVALANRGVPLAPGSLFRPGPVVAASLLALASVSVGSAWWAARIRRREEATTAPLTVPPATGDAEREWREAA